MAVTALALALFLGTAVAQAAAPTLGATSVTNLQGVSALLRASVDPEGLPTTYVFEYVDQAGFDAGGFSGARRTPTTPAGSGADPHPARAAISGLTPSTTYHYRLLATNSSGATTGTSGTFVTTQGFGFLAGSDGFTASVLSDGGAAASVSGSHPYRLSFEIGFNRGGEFEDQSGVPFADGDLRDLRIEMPPGLLLNPAALDKCSVAAFNTPRVSPFGVSRHLLRADDAGAAAGDVHDGRALRDRAPGGPRRDPADPRDVRGRPDPARAGDQQRRRLGGGPRGSRRAAPQASSRASFRQRPGGEQAVTDFDAIAAGMTQAVPFAGHLGLDITSVAEGEAVVRLPERPELTNHVGSQHAGVLFTVAETASGAAFVGAFAERMGEVTPLARQAEITYEKIAKGPIDATAKLGVPKAEALATLDSEGKVEFPCEVTLADQSGLQVAKATIRWHVRLNKPTSNGA